MNHENTIWAFDLGKASMGTAVLRNLDFPERQSFLIPEGLARRGPVLTAGSPANRYRAAQTRKAHLEREKWLEKVWSAGFPILLKRKLEYVNYQTKRKKKMVKGKMKIKSIKYGGVWEVTQTADYRLEREFAPRQFTQSGKPIQYSGCKAKDGAPAAKPEDFSICYNSALLRIKLLFPQRGERLEPWQVFKALRASIQKRGYGKVPWASGEEKAEEAAQSIADETTYREARDAWQRFIDEIPKEFHYPCFYEAYKMKLWRPGEPLKDRTDYSAESTRRVVFPAAAVQTEVFELAEAAEKSYPIETKKAFESVMAEFRRGQVARWHRLNERRKRCKKPELAPLGFRKCAGSFAELLVFGPGGKPATSGGKRPIASFDPDIRKETGLRPGTTDDWKSAIGQKVARFSNRIVADCVLIPRCNVCHAAAKPGFDPTQKRKFITDETFLVYEVILLLKLNNLQVMRAGGLQGLTYSEIDKLRQECLDKAKACQERIGTPRWIETTAKAFEFTKAAWRKYCEKQFEAEPGNPNDEIEPPKTSGRSRFCRPGLKILRELLVSGIKPSEMHAELIKPNSVTAAKLGLNIFTDDSERNRQLGMVHSDLQFLLRMRDEKGEEKVFIPNHTLDTLVKQSVEVVRKTNDETIFQEIAKVRKEIIHKNIIGKQNNPIVRNRLEIFYTYLRALTEKYGEPESVVLEFVRDDKDNSWLGKDAKKRLKNVQDANRKLNDETRQIGEGLKYKLWRIQGGECVYGKQVVRDGVCLYTQRGLPQPGTPGWNELEIDHIVPRGQPYNGPDSIVNKVLTFREVANQQKKKRIPYEWFHQDRPNEWDGYVRFVLSKSGSLGRRKAQLLTQPNAAELAERYVALAETAWIARLAQTIVRVHFGWPLEHQSGVKRVMVISGGLTARIRRKYFLNTLLGQNRVTDFSAIDQVRKLAARDLRSNLGKAEQEEATQARHKLELLREGTEKDRSDKRHHALDAMILTFIREWTRNPAKEDFFRFHGLEPNYPAKRNYMAVWTFFRAQLEQVLPSNLSLPKAKLGALAYARTYRLEEKESKGVYRDKVVRSTIMDLGYPSGPEAQQKCFDLAHARRMASAVLDPELRRKLATFLKSPRSEEEWKTYAAQIDSGIPRLKKDQPAKIQTKLWNEIRVRQVSLRDMAYEDEATRVFDPIHAREQVEWIVELNDSARELKELLRGFFAQSRTQEDWERFRRTELSARRCRIQPPDDTDGKSIKSKSIKFGDKVDALASKPLPKTFKLSKASIRVNRICDPTIRQRVRDFLHKHPEADEATWNRFCDEFSQVRKVAGGKAEVGAPIRKVRVFDGFPKEYGVLKGSYYKDLKEHKGQFVYIVDDGTPSGLVELEPVYVFQSPTAIRAKVLKSKNLKRLVGFFQSGCTVEISQAISATYPPINPGRFILNTITDDKRVRMSDATGLTSERISLATVVAAGFRRVDTIPGDKKL